MDRLTRAWTWIRSDPLRTTVAATAAVAAIAAGMAIGLFVTSIRGEAPVGAAPSPSASPSAELSPSASGSPSLSATPSASASPTATPQETESPSPDPTDGSAPAPAPTPQVGLGGTPVGGGTAPLEGTWEELAAIPGEDGEPSSVVALADGRIALFRWTVPDSEAMVIYDPASDAWEVPAFDGEAPGVGTDQAFVLGNDDRVYTHDHRLVEDGGTWRREAFELVRETETWAGMPLGTDADGRIYRPADDTGSNRTELVIYDPESDTFDRSAAVDGSYGFPVSVGDRLAVFGADASSEPGLIWYDPAADAWGETVSIDHGQLDLYTLTASPDGTVYATNADTPAPELWAIDSEDGSALPVEPPDGVSEWSVDLVWHDDALYAIGRGGAWRFTPDP